ncbi:uncharacterized protein DNG_05863 [Cephalotrichum gorgonifer]|uniref:N-acetyltransferase domain-containing protein n=1 Tax=Cephalotrichum gorgonifer TaxID=2041049 RepID=A0AAE8SVV9_9PEZI|nr:uncharacterized protein DNG_05863 [Cephalotrichum gorgonifer]
MRIRPATPADLPAVGDVILEAMSVDPEWMPFFPRGARQDQEYIKFIESILKPGLDPKSQDLLVTVAELSDEESHQEGGLIVAVAAWDMSLAPVEDQGSCSVAPEGAVRGGTGGVAALVNAAAQGRTRHFDRYDRCMHLRIMATRPHNQKHGYAKALCEWGIDAAGRRGMGVTVLTGPRGYILFSDLGFVDLGPCPVRVGGGREELVVKAMFLAPERKPRRPSFLGSLFGHVFFGHVSP